MSEPTMDEVLVKKLREWAGIYEGEEQGQLMALAADRIEAISVMTPFLGIGIKAYMAEKMGLKSGRRTGCRGVTSTRE